MVVTYRLQGLDGEATEEMVSEIDGAGAEADEDPEVTYAVCAELRERRGLEALLSLVPVLSGESGAGSFAARARRHLRAGRLASSCDCFEPRRS